MVLIFDPKNTKKIIRVGDRLCMDAQLPVTKGLWPALWFMGEECDDTWEWPKTWRNRHGRSRLGVRRTLWSPNGFEYVPPRDDYDSRDYTPFVDQFGDKIEFTFNGATDSIATPAFTRYCIGLYDSHVVVTRAEIDAIGGTEVQNSQTVRYLSWPTTVAGYADKDYFLLINLAVGGTLGGDVSQLATDGSVAGQMIVGNIVKQGNLIDDTTYQSPECPVYLSEVSVQDLLEELQSRRTGCQSSS